MKKTILSLLVVLMATTGAWAQGTDSHWPDFDCYNYEHYATFMAAIKIDGVIVTANYQNWNQFEVAAFVGNECRSAGESTNFLFNGYVEDGDPYPILDGMQIYYIGDGEAVTFKMYNHATGVEYTACTVTLGGEEISVVTGVDHDEYLFDSYNPVFLNFTTPAEPAVPAGPATSGITWNASTNSGTFLMPAYDVEVTTELWYRLSQTEDNTAYQTKTNVFLERTLQAGGWNTFCAPFAISNPATVFGEGVQVKAFSGSSLSGNTLTLNFTDAATIAAATPYLIRLKNGASNVDLTADGKEFAGVTQSWTPVDVNPDEGVATFKAALAPVPMTANDKTILFVTGGNALTFPNTDGDMKAFRAYFQLSQSMDVRAFSLNFDDETTGIQGIGQSDNARFDNSVYDLQGRRVAKPAKGLYIVNGKKTVVK